MGAKLEDFFIEFEQNFRGDFIYMAWLPTQPTWISSFHPWDTKAFSQPAPFQEPRVIAEKL